MRAAVMMGLAGAFAGCNGDKGTDTGTSGAPTLTQVRDEVFTPASCGAVGCHEAGGTAGANELILTAGDEHAALVDVESAASPGQILVVPGDSANSYLVAKLEGAVGIVGSPMPPPFGQLPEDQIQLVRDWIDAGAAND